MNLIIFLHIGNYVRLRYKPLKTGAEQPDFLRLLCTTPVILRRAGWINRLLQAYGCSVSLEQCRAAKCTD